MEILIIKSLVKNMKLFMKTQGNYGYIFDEGYESDVSHDTFFQ